MRIVVADSRPDVVPIVFNEFTGTETSFLCSYFYLVKNGRETQLTKQLRDHTLANKKKPTIYIDSGVFSARKRGIDIPYKELGEFYQRNSIFCDHVFNMDEGSHKQQLSNCKALKLMGVPVIGIYHMDMPLDYLLQFYEINPYISVSFFKCGGPGGKQATQQLDRIFNFLLKHFSIDKFIKVHALGTEAFSILNKYPFFSADSTGAKSAYAYGFNTINHPKSRQPIQVKKNDKSLIQNGFLAIKGHGRQSKDTLIRTIEAYKSRVIYNKHLSEIWQRRGIRWE